MIYLITITRKIEVDDSISPLILRREIKNSLDNFKGENCRTVNGLKYKPISSSIIHVIRSEK